MTRITEKVLGWTTRGLAIVLAMILAPAASRADTLKWDGAEPAPGVYFDVYEPSFYAGFAPRTQDPSRVHLELSRGNQLRLTLVLGPEELEGYLINLLMRRSVVQTLVDEGIIVLTTNLAFERFSTAINDALVEDVVLRQGDLGTDAYREQSIAVMERLNPGRVFRLALPFQPLLTDWHRVLTELPKTGPGSATERLDAANAILPGRVNLYELNDELDAALNRAQKLVRAGKGAADPDFRSAASAFLESATLGHYPVVDAQVRAVEFTAVYPAGTTDAWITYRGAKLPDLGATGVWPLVPHNKGRGITGRIDYLSPNPGYGWIPLLAYEPVGGFAYNALHSAGIRARLDDTPFLPAEWTRVVNERSPDQVYRNLWIGSRGPISNGSTRLPSGHMSELRDLLPSSSEDLAGVEIFRNLPQCHDVFDTDGNGELEVIGLTYFLAYRARGHLPQAAYAPNDRDGFYAWLYQGNIERHPDGGSSIIEVPVCRFVGQHNAQEQELLHRIPLSEAPYTAETIQFYRTTAESFQSMKGLELNLELRRIGVGYELNQDALMLE